MGDAQRTLVVIMFALLGVLFLLLPWPAKAARWGDGAGYPSGYATRGNGNWNVNRNRNGNWDKPVQAWCGYGPCAPYAYTNNRMWTTAVAYHSPVVPASWGAGGMQQINVGAGGQFDIALPLGGNADQWQGMYDSNSLTLVQTWLDTPWQGYSYASGNQIFRFQARQRGTSTLTFHRLSAWGTYDSPRAYRILVW